MMKIYLKNRHYFSTVEYLHRCNSFSPSWNKLWFSEEPKEHNNNKEY
jgi:hypothetical protein